MVFFLGLILVTCEASTSEVYALNTFKEAIYEDPLLALSNWNVRDAAPCDWSGITCSMVQDQVLKLILHGNNLVGPIPNEIGKLKYLKVLDLGKNQLSGPIPPQLGNLTNLVKINLQSNGLTGKLPPELGNLKYLEELRLDRNKLQGIVPGSNSSDFTSSIHGMYAPSWNTTGLCSMAQLKVADFSYNFFVGSIPKCLESLPRSSFQGNCLQYKDPKQRSSAQCAGASPAKTHSRVNATHQPAQNGSKHHAASRPAWLLALEIVTGTMVGSIVLVALVTALLRCKSKPPLIIPWKKSSSNKDQTMIYIDSDILKNVLRLSRQELEVSCEDFSNIIGSSPDSLVYKGTMKGGPEIAVISLSIKEEHWTGYLELYFQREVADLARLDHENAGKLLGYCRESNPFTRMLVFEYASNGTLYEHLHYGEGCQLSWTRRMKIVIGIARGLKYLHTELDPPFYYIRVEFQCCISYGRIFPQDLKCFLFSFLNFLILVDFESWKSILSRSEKNSVSIGNEGAICVLPNSLEERHLDVQGNIYAFGVLLLEIVSGRPSYCKDKGHLVDWAKDFLELPEVMSYVVDPELKHFSYDDLQAICEVVNLCLDPDPSKRVSMEEICAMLESKIDTSVSAELKASSLAWAELALSSN
ncbi:leucine-rich repeat protein kinase family protein [Actinidia rufa]|uniref:Leucine-rich repeat protein kinase family protein n=1 Tax=Actinidia rufa TaxID=165716 RepID=A0A7J0DKH7_9ERIC|nr:leucine-rich repeat protein kinase family protein [Actinidia rufa]